MKRLYLERGTVLIHFMKNNLKITRIMSIFAIYKRKQAFYAPTKVREKRHGHLPCDAREGIKNLSLRFRNHFIG
jgi:hypothetical protein